jgi:hypothetical protein
MSESAHFVRAIGLLTVLGAACLSPTPGAWSSELPQQWRALRVGVLPVRSYARHPEELFGEGPLAERLRQETGRWQRFLERQVAALDMVDVVTISDLRKRVQRSQAYMERRQLAQEHFGLAVEQYRTLNGAQALVHLSRADRLQRDALVGLVDPTDVADVGLYQGLAQVEMGNRSRAHGAFRRMLVMDSGRTFQPGYYPKKVEESIKDAFVDLVEAVDLPRARYRLADLNRMGEALSVDAWVLAFIVGAPERPELLIQVIDAQSRVVEVSERFRVVNLDWAREKVDRLLTGWHTGAMRAADPPQPASRPRLWSVDLSYSHSLMMKHDGTRALFHSPGARLGVRFRPEENMSVFLRLIQMVSVPDANGDLLETLVSTRVVVGAGLIGGVQDVLLSVQAGLELGVISSNIVMTTDVDCKHFGADHPRCGSYAEVLAPRALIGLHLELGLEWGFSETWYMTTAVGFTSYVYAQDIIADLNFPLDLAIGVGTRF